MFAKIRLVKGSMLITALMIIVFFSLILAAMARMLSNSDQNNLTASVGTQAELLAHSGTEYAMSRLFEINKVGAVQSSIWEGEPPSSKSLIPDNCSVVSQGDDNIFCNGYRNGCYLEKLQVDAREVLESSVVTGADVNYEYTIISEAVCLVPFTENGCDTLACSKVERNYEVRRREVTKTADINWNTVD